MVEKPSLQVVINLNSLNDFPVNSQAHGFVFGLQLFITCKDIFNFGCAFGTFLLAFHLHAHFTPLFQFLSILSLELTCVWLCCFFQLHWIQISIFCCIPAQFA